VTSYKVERAVAAVEPRAGPRKALGALEQVETRRKFRQRPTSLDHMIARAFRSWRHCSWNLLILKVVRKGGLEPSRQPLCKNFQ
jgi:hypothetical protein